MVFRTATGNELQHEKEIRDLADVKHLPQKVVVIKCKGHSNLPTLEAKGKEAADQQMWKSNGASSEEIEINEKQKVWWSPLHGGQVPPRTSWTCTSNPKQIRADMRQWWLLEAASKMKSLLQSCEVGQYHNVRPTEKPSIGQYSLPSGPAQEIIIAFCQEKH